MPEADKQSLEYADQVFKKGKLQRWWTAFSFDQIPTAPVDEKKRTKGDDWAMIDELREEEDFEVGSDEYDALEAASNANTRMIKANIPTNQNLKKVHKNEIFPEIVFMGHTNAGKSTLVQHVLAWGRPDVPQSHLHSPTSKKGHKGSLSNSINSAFPVISKKHGFTKSFNCYGLTIPNSGGNQIRLVDIPGYGYKSLKDQGAVVEQYLERRTNLRMAILVIDATRGIQDEDKYMLSTLNKYGVTWQVVLTKSDMLVGGDKKLEALGREMWLAANPPKSGSQMVKLTKPQKEKWARRALLAETSIQTQLGKILVQVKKMDTPECPSKALERVIAVSNSPKMLQGYKHDFGGSGISVVRNAILQICGMGFHEQKMWKEMAKYGMS
ncbi:MIOREX complex component 8 [Yarrowia lipolytica]|jgi:GTP-binding protein EngB required for normal cell division|nr:MIOREX complex component 8 [Yarrowia lipolytica]